LGNRQHVRTVLLVNRIDCCGERLDKFTIHVGDNPTVSKNPKCFSGFGKGGGFYDCNLHGRYVGI
jgi:hypothetical protein